MVQFNKQGKEVKMKILRFMKHAEKCKNRIIIPKFIIKNFGRDFYLDIDPETGVMTLTPINLEKRGQ